MTPRRRLLVAVAGALCAAALLLAARRAGPPRDCARIARAPRLAPDYADLTLPPNIAPLNFRVAEPGRRWSARLSGAAGQPIAVRGRGGIMRIPMGPWRRLLAANTGREITIDVCVRDGTGRWSRFAPVHNQVAREPIDSHLVYRYFRPTYSANTPLGLYQRDLTSFGQTALLRSPSSGRQCLNCHAFASGNPNRFSFQLRGAHKTSAMMVVQDGVAGTIDTRTTPGQRPAAVSTWHPTGQWIVCARNWIRQYFHEAGSPGRDALDTTSSLALVDVRSGQTSEPPELNPPGYLPTFPCWSPDGRWLYYSRLKRFWPASSTMPVAEQTRVRYDLVRTAFDPGPGTWGQTELVLAAAAVGKSILHPRVSPDGHWLVACLAAYGGFPIFRAQADLAIIDLTRRPWHAVPLNSEPATRRDTWHSWSSNSRWLVFSRKSDNGLFARPYLRYVASDGRPGKAFILPQADPTAYGRLLYTYNLPELVTGAVTISEAELARAAGPVSPPAKDDEVQAP